MTNDEIRMTKEARMTKSDKETGRPLCRAHRLIPNTWLRHSHFRHSFVIGHSSFVIPANSSARCCPKPSSAGFSLLEVVLALAILTAAIAVLGELVRSGLRNAQLAR